MNLQLRHSLVWQMIGPIPLMVIAAIAAAWFIVPRMISDNATNQAVLAGASIATQFKTLREYYTENVVDKILSDGTFRASSNHKGNAKTIPLPATMILDLSAMLAKQNTAINLYSKFPFPNRANRPLDAFQQEAWDFLVRNLEETYSRQEMLDGRQVVRVAVADTMVVQACVNCHNTIAGSPKKDWKLGDVRGVLEVTSVIDAELANGAALSRSIIIGAVLIGLGLLGMALLVAGSVTRPIENLIGAMQKVAAGNFETVLPGLGRKDEIGRLAGGFNHKVSELGAAREREVVDRARTATMQAELTRVARQWDDWPPQWLTRSTSPWGRLWQMETRACAGLPIRRRILTKLGWSWIKSSRRDIVPVTLSKAFVQFSRRVRSDGLLSTSTNLLERFYC
jgi:HAMP domain-containing protein